MSLRVQPIVIRLVESKSMTYGRGLFSSLSSRMSESLSSSSGMIGLPESGSVGTSGGSGYSESLSITRM